MTCRSLRAGGLLLAFLALSARATIHYVNQGNLNPRTPYTTWSTAATNIEDAVFWSSSGDTVLVTNGIYQYGGSSFSGSNRVYDSLSPMTIQSVNGPAVTTIVGYQIPGATNGSDAVRCVYLTSGSTLSGFTLTNGATPTSSGSSGGGVYCTSTNCLVTNCVIVGNAAYGGGGGAYSGTLVNCVLSENATPYNVSSGGGAYRSILINCVLAWNTAQYYGGGAYDSALINCTVVSNSTTVAGFLGPAGPYNAVDNSTLENSIVYYNLNHYGAAADVDPTDTATNCCLSGTNLAGVNNFTNPPGFLNQAGGNYQLQIGSPCIAVGNTAFVPAGNDLAGNPRIINGAVDLGAYESDYTNVVHYVSLNSTNSVSPYTNWMTAATSIQAAVAVAQPGDFVVASSGIYRLGSVVVYGQEANCVALTNAITLLGLYGAQLTAIEGSSSPKRCIYVGSNAVLNGFSLVSGSTRTSGDPIKEESGGGAWCEASGVISNCVFGGTNFPYPVIDPCNAQNQGGGVYGGTVYNSIFSYDTAQGNGGAAAAANLVNCVITTNFSYNTGYSYSGAIFQGTASNCLFMDNSGGGACQSVLYDCVLATNQGGGASQSTLYDCLVTSNENSGTVNCTNYNCTLANNSGANGGGASGGILSGCNLWSNTASSDGGGAYQCTLSNCNLAGNTAHDGGGAYQSTLFDCLVISNSAAVAAGGADIGVLYNCTVVGNTAPLGGGILGATLYNSTIYYNTAANYGGGTLNYCDTTPLPSGPGDITIDPAFVNLAGANYQLQSSSPCINSGNNAYVTVANDLAGSPRIAGGTVDIGAYEYQTPTSVISYAYLQQYSLPTDGSVDYADLDGTGFNIYQDWVAGLNPTNPASVLIMLTPVVTNSIAGVTVAWQSVANILYNLQRSTNFFSQPVFTTVQSNLAGQPGTTSYADTSATNSVPYFYRVGVLAP